MTSCIELLHWIKKSLFCIELVQCNSLSKLFQILYIYQQIYLQKVSAKTQSHESSIIWSMVLIFDCSWLHSSVKKKNWGFFEEKAGCTSYFGFIALFSEKSSLEFVLVNASFKIDKFFQCYKHEIYILNNFLQMPEVFRYAT